MQCVTTPPGPPPEPARPTDWRDGPQGQQSSSQPWPQYPDPQYTGQPPLGGQEQPHPQGYPQQGHYGQYAQPRKANGLGIAALVLGILSLPAAFLAGVPGIVLGLVAVVLGVLGLRRVRTRRADNRGMAIAGLVTGVLGLLLGILVLVFTVFVVRTTGDCLTELEQTGDQVAYEQCVQESVGQ